jgi:hypothetical protein
MAEAIRPYSFSELFDHGFRMIKHTWKPTLLTAIGGIGAPSLLLALSLRRIFMISGRMLEVGEEPGAELWLRSILPAGALAVLAGILVALGYLVCYLVASEALRGGILGEQAGIGVLIGRGTGRHLGRVVLQFLLKGLVFGALWIIPSVVIGVLGSRGSNPGGLIVLLAVAAFLAAIGATLWLGISLQFSTQAVVFGECKTISGLKASMRIVSGGWWRVFGITLVLHIMISSIGGLLVAPVMLVTGISVLPGLLAAAQPSPELIARMVFLPMWLLSMLQQLAMVLLLPTFFGLFYVDLAARQEDQALLPSY